MTSYSVGGKLREARQARGLRREAVAMSIGKSFSSIAAYESDAVEPPLHVLRELARTYGVTIAELMGEATSDAA